MYKPVPAQVDLPALEREILAFWAENRIFERSLAATADGPPWVFYEGPPTANGMPGTHHVEARVFKDVFPRYRTMKGYSVPRKAGWDCHGLPVELAVEKELGFSGKGDIEAYGVAEFNAKCRESVLRHVDAFRAMTERMGYWVDLDEAYWTMDSAYVQSVWWSLAKIFDDGRLVQDHRVAPYCPRCGTGLSDHELAQGYETVVDPSVYVRFPLTSGPHAGAADLLVWTTTPWTLVSNTAVAVRPDVTYALVEAPEGAPLILAEPLITAVLGEDAKVLATFPGSDMERWSYQRPFELVAFPDDVATHYVALADYVTTEDGTGLVHQAPAFGAEDLEVSRRYGLPVVNPVKPDGHFSDEVPLVGGVFFKKADEALVADLQARGVLFKHLEYEHAYPHCWRCHTALIYYAQPSWYIRTTAVKDALLRENESTNWYPNTIKWGRYGDWLHNNIDWALSRNRYWGTPLPIWRCMDGHLVAVSSLKHLSELVGRDVTEMDPHRPFIDDGDLPVPGGRLGDDARSRSDRRLVRLRRDAVRTVGIPASAGQPGRSVPGAVHLRGDRPDPRLVLHADGRGHARVRRVLVRERALPRPHPGRGRSQDVQAPGQHPRAVATDGGARRGRPALVHGLLRFPLVGAPGRAHRAAGRRAQDAADLLEHRRVPVPLRPHVGLDPDAAAPAPAERPAMDRWALSEAHRLARDVDAAMADFDTQKTGRLLAAYVDDLSNWYVRRCRRRFWAGDPAALATLHECLRIVTLLTAPLTPFIAERVWQDLFRPADAMSRRTGDEADSVHLASWPEPDVSLIDDDLATQMGLARRLVELGRAARADSAVKTRQPLSRALIGAHGWTALSQDLRGQIAEELNVTRLESLGEAGGDLVDYSAKANFRALGKRFGKGTQPVAAAIAAADAAELAAVLRAGNNATVTVDGESIEVGPEEVIVTETPREGWAVAREGETVALDLTITPELRRAGLAREAIRAIQEARKNAGLEVSDRISLRWHAAEAETVEALREHADLIAAEVLAISMGELPAPAAGAGAVDADPDLGLTVQLAKA